MIAALLAAAVLAPLFAYGPRVLDDTRLDGGVLAVVTLALALAVARKRRAMPLPRGLGWILVGLVVGCVALLWQDRHFSEVVGGMADRAPWLAAWALLGLAVAQPQAVERAWPWVLGGIAASAWLAFLQWLGLDLLSWKPAPESPSTGPLSNRPQAVELWLVAGFAAWARFGQTPQARAWLIAFAPAALLAGYLDSFAGRVALLAGLAVLMLRPTLRPRRWAPVALVLGLMLTGEATRMLAPPPFATREAGEAGVEAWASTSGRVVLYQACLGHALSTPGGVGFGRFETDYPEWRPLDEQRMSAANYANITTRRPKTPHSEPLLLLLEFGWLGAGLILGGVVLLLRDPTRARWTAPALAALSVFLLVRSPLSDHGSLLPLAVLLIAARRTEGHALRNDDAASREEGNRAWAWPVALGTSVLAFVPAPSQIGGELAFAARLPLDQEAPVEVMERAVFWRPWDARALGILSIDRSREAEPSLERVREPLLQALRHDPTDLFALNQLFVLDTRRGADVEGLVWLARAEELAPEHPAVRTNRTILQRELAEVHRKLGLARLEQQAPNAHADLFLSQLWTAMAEARDGAPLKAASALRAAAVYAQGNRGLIERVARDPELDEARVYALIQRLVPVDEQAYLGPPVPEGPSTTD